MTTAPDLVPSIVKTVTVPLEPSRAFDLFTAGIDQWWPLDGHSVGGATSKGLALNAEAIVETLADGTTTTWGEVLAWEPPSRLILTWHPGEESSPQQTQIAVTFESTSGGTLVRLEHSGWERVDLARRTSYDGGWDNVLAAFASAA